MSVLVRVLAGIGGHTQWKWGDGVWWGDGEWGANRGPDDKSVGCILGNQKGIGRVATTLHLW